jgi:hypothetical protein
MPKNLRNQGLRTITVQRKNKSARGRARHLKFWVPAFAGTNGECEADTNKTPAFAGAFAFRLMDCRAFLREDALRAFARQ